MRQQRPAHGPVPDLLNHLRPTASGLNWALVTADSLTILPTLRQQSVDLIFADPPYRLSNGGSTCRNGRRASVDKGAWDRSDGVVADHAFHMQWLSACQRLLKPSGTIWVSGTQHVIFSIGYAMQELGFHLLNTITWFKPNASPNLACRFFTHSTEILLWASPSRTRPLGHRFHYEHMKTTNGGRQMRDVWNIAERPEPGGHQVVWSIPTPGPREKAHGKHPTQKPLALLERVLLASTSAGARVLDPFCGSAPPELPRSSSAATSSASSARRTTSTLQQDACAPSSSLSAQSDQRALAGDFHLHAEFTDSAPPQDLRSCRRQKPAPRRAVTSEPVSGSTAVGPHLTTHLSPRPLNP